MNWWKKVRCPKCFMRTNYAGKPPCVYCHGKGKVTRRKALKYLLGE